MSEITRVGADLAKHVIQVHAVDVLGKLVTNRPLQRDKFMSWCAQLPAGCLIAMEASSSAHHWARKLVALGLDARIIAAQQGMLCVHRLREGFKQERTACISRIRGLLAEFGVVVVQSPQALREVLSEVIEDGGNELSGLARLVIERAQSQWREHDEHIAWCDQRIAVHFKDDQQANAATQLMGVGPVTASAVVATVGDFRQFKNGSQFGAWLGLTPRQNSSGGKNNLGGITKRGDMYLRMLLIQAAKSAVMTAHKRDDPISAWVFKLREKSGWQKAVVALANKNARHVSVKPGGLCALPLAVDAP